MPNMQTTRNLNFAPAQMESLWARFHANIKGFSDFENPGSEFVEKEAAYKRAILKKFQQELGAEKLAGLVAEGRGTKAIDEIGRSLVAAPSNFVSFYGWKTTFGEDEQVICDLLGEYLRVASGP